MTKCNGCGGCCDPVVASMTHDDLRRILPIQLDAEQAENRQFMLNHLTPISRGEGLRRAPHLTQGGITFAFVAGRPVEVFSVFYECDFYDRETRSCQAYDARPPMCSQYPWYGGRPDPSAALPGPCEFHLDVGRVPVPFDPTQRKPREEAP